MSIISGNNLTSPMTELRNIFDDVSFQIDSDWKLGFIGRNGRGKTTFFRLLLGQFEYSGSIRSSEKFEYIPYEVSDMSRRTYDVMADICPECMEWQIKRRSSILKLICGQKILHEGAIKVESGLIISLVPQDTSHLRRSVSDACISHPISCSGQSGACWKPHRRI